MHTEFLIGRDLIYSSENFRINFDCTIFVSTMKNSFIVIARKTLQWKCREKFSTLRGVLKTRIFHHSRFSTSLSLLQASPVAFLLFCIVFENYSERVRDSFTRWSFKTNVTVRFLQFLLWDFQKVKRIFRDTVDSRGCYSTSNFLCYFPWMNYVISLKPYKYLYSIIQ